MCRVVVAIVFAKMFGVRVVTFLPVGWAVVQSAIVLRSVIVIPLPICKLPPGVGTLISGIGLPPASVVASMILSFIVKATGRTIAVTGFVRIALFMIGVWCVISWSSAIRLIRLFIPGIIVAIIALFKIGCRFYPLGPFGFSGFAPGEK